MARKPKTTEEAPKATIEDLDDEQRQELTFQHKGIYQQRLAAKKKADADFKNACKIAKAELGDSAIADIKLIIELEDEEGAIRLKARRESEARIARWMGVALGTQTDMFTADQAFEDGKRAAFDDKPPKPPSSLAASSPEYQRWLDGHNAGTQARAAKSFGGTLREANPPGAFEVHDPSKIGTAAPSHTRQ